MLNRLLFTTLTLFLLANTVLLAQRDPSALALDFLRKDPTTLGLTPADVADVRISDQFTSAHNGVAHVWLQQQYLGTPVFNALFGIHILPNNEIHHLGHRFVADLANKVNTQLPSLAADQALQLALAQLDLDAPTMPALKQRINARNMVFDQGNVSKRDIPVSACYWLDETGTSARLSWNILIDQANTSDYWNLHIDAQTGALLARYNLTVYCNDGHPHRMGETCPHDASPTPLVLPEANSAAALLSGSYNVFALPVESPSFGGRSQINDPEDPTASPFGWHDTNGQGGAEYNYTRGNNVWAYEDIVQDNTGSDSESAPGGSNNTYDFPFDPNATTSANKLAGITNLFYMANMMHDISYLYGFDEAAGNFQIKNYTNAGTGGDALWAEALDGSGTDNANMATPAEGSAPRMQMFDWSRSGGNVVQVNAPAAIAGVYFGQAASDWGAPITQTPITGDVVQVEVSGGGLLGCSTPLNDLNGKIAMVERGDCTFGEKALFAQQKGAKACIVCNFEPNTIGMLIGAFGSQVNIPVVMMSSVNCTALRLYLAQGLNVSLVQPPVTGPDYLDGSFDNGIIAHEYAHGISQRLTGGPSNIGCLLNGEQMGEGWSDFFALAMTVTPDGSNKRTRGVGTYVMRQPNDGIGIRRFPYSPDMNVNPLTYTAVAQNSSIHAVGEVWASALWDLYWALVDQYGFDANLKNTNSGNGRAIQLVMDGMTLQPCSPGFVEARNAILLADKMNYNGADTCLIWNVFSRRGLGRNAVQGDSDNTVDGVSNFDPIDICIKELKIKKETTSPTIEAGGVASFKITVTNHKGSEVSGVTVSDTIPQGLTLIPASTFGTLNGNVLTWDVGTMPNGQVMVLTYSCQADQSGSLRLYRDSMETAQEWVSNASIGPQAFQLQNTFKVVGQSSWKINNVQANSDATLTSTMPLFITGNRPALRFWNRYWVERGNDGGFLETSESGTGGWKPIPASATFRNGYNSPINYESVAIPFLEGYSGNSQGWKHSYLDLTPLLGTNQYLRFRFGSDANDAFDGWYIDDVELLDVLSYNSTACVQSTQGDFACATAPEGGVVVNPATTDAETVLAETPALRVQPNPAQGIAYVQMSQALAGNTQLTLSTPDGRLVAQRTLYQLGANEAVALDLTTLPAGVYTLQMAHSSGIWVQKLIVQ